MKRKSRVQRQCPYLEEVVMVSCQAYPIKKMIPRSRISTPTRCLEGGFAECPLYQEIMARMESAGEEAVPPAPPGKEAS